jgi:hypothetical protein
MATNKFLSEYRVDAELAANRAIPANQIGSAGFFAGDGFLPEKISFCESVANQHRENNYRFVPLVTKDLSLLCLLDILFLRTDLPSGVISAGDLDNRIKTLIDALRKPHNANELRGNETPAAGEDPFFCLLEDDNLVTSLTVETDMLLDRPNGNANSAIVKLVITVELKPDYVTMLNLSFA